jgi:4'-phosphopantetheinyl transferase
MPLEFDIVLCALDELPADVSVLDAREQRRAERLHDEVDRRRYVAAHTALRRELGERLETAPASLEFTREPCSQCGGPHGRPIVLRPGGSLARRAGLHFSLSHSGGHGLLAIAPTPVGVDIEALPDASMCQQLTALLHPREQVRILSAPEEAQRTLFTRLWCRKEAYLKGLGVGLTHDSTEGYLSSLERTPGWHVANIDAPAGFAGAVATAAPPERHSAPIL